MAISNISGINLRRVDAIDATPSQWHRTCHKSLGGHSQIAVHQKIWHMIIPIDQFEAHLPCIIAPGPALSTTSPCRRRRSMSMSPLNDRAVGHFAQNIRRQGNHRTCLPLPLRKHNIFFWIWNVLAITMVAGG